MTVGRAPLRAFAVALLLAAGAAADPAAASRLGVRELTLDNGMRFLLVPRPGAGMVAAGWAARAGSGDDSPGRTGLAHLIEHLMLMGTRTVGTREAAREEQALAQLDRAHAELRELSSRPPSGKSARRRAELEARLERLERKARELALDGELSFLYSEAGAIGLGASTLKDLTFYYVTVPAEKLELWFWLESDRLLEPVFRELYREKRIVDEERRMRIGSTPTGRVNGVVSRSFWGESPYAWRPLGAQGDLDPVGRAEARRFFDAHYRTGNLTAALVGSFDPERVERLARRYFGRLPGGRSAGEAPSPNGAAYAPTPRGRTVREACDCPPQTRALYPTVRFRHPDSYPLQVLAGVLNGRSGRLHRSLVLEREIAFSASAGQHPLARAGHFSFLAEARGEVAPEILLAAWDAELARLRTELVPSDELDKVKNQLAADALRRLKDPAALMKQLLIYEALGGWREIEEWPARVRAVGAEQVREATRRYLGPERRLVALVSRRPSAAPASGPE